MFMNFRRFLLNLHKFILITVISINISIANAAVISTVKPIGFIAEAIASGVTETSILIPDGSSPHIYALKPSDLVQIRSADLVIWVGKEMETFMPAALKNVDVNKQLELMTLSKIQPLLRKSQHHHHDDNDHDHDHDHDHATFDEHIWLSPEIADIIAQSIHDKLLTLYPDQQAILDQNLSAFRSNLHETEQIIAKKLKPIQNKGYFVFHDAFGYFESVFGLKNLGNFTINPAIQPGLKRIYEIQKDLKEKQAVCIFSEPQFNPEVIYKIVAGTDIHIGELEPLGIGISPTKEAYLQFLLRITQQFSNCLTQ